MFEQLVQAALANWLTLLCAFTFAWLVGNRYQKGLNRFPGPFAASLTNWWRLYDAATWHPHVNQLRLHEKYGKIVRLGPNCLSVADPEALKTIYGLNKGFVKSEFYPVQQPLMRGERLQSMFNTTDEAYHAQLRRCVNHAFSMSAIVQYEHSVDIVTEQFLEQTAQLFSRTGEAANFARWLQYYTFDVIGQITNSKSYGFVERNEDVQGIIAALAGTFDYVALIGQLPFLDRVLWKNPMIQLLSRLELLPNAFPVVTFAKERMQERIAELDASKESIAGEGLVTQSRNDLLSLFLKAKADHPDFFHDGRVLTMSVSMVFAGSETTAISLSAVFYHLLRSPKSLANLRAELEDAEADGRLRSGCSHVSWAEAQTLPYLDACIKEAFRMHPAVGLPLERIVPQGGIEICGQYVPGGTIIGANAWTIHRLPELWGEDVHVFRPERWTSADPGKRKEMEAKLFHFGMGNRTCIGKNISLLEMYKLVPSFLRKFNIEFEDASDDWKLHSAWFVQQRDFRCRFKERGSANL